MAPETVEKMTAAERSELHAEKIAALLIEQMRENRAPWQIPWEKSKNSLMLPENASTGRKYNGSNALYLWALSIENGWNDNRFMTYKQAEACEAQVKKGEKATTVVYPCTHYEVTKKDDNGRPVIGENGQPVKVYVPYENGPRMKYYSVFNSCQIDNMPERKTPEPKHEWEIHAQAERIAKNSGVNINHTPSNRAFYSPALDAVFLPSKTQFSEPGKYYSVLLHEISHSTGAAHRLNRDGITGGHEFGSEAYAREELRAEIGSMLIGQQIGLGHDPSNHISYTKSWCKALQDDAKEIYRACADSQKIQEMVLGYDPELSKEQHHEIKKTYTISDATQTVERNKEYFAVQQQEVAQREGEAGRSECHRLSEGFWQSQHSLVHLQRIDAIGISSIDLRGGEEDLETAIKRTATTLDDVMLARVGTFQIGTLTDAQKSSIAKEVQGGDMQKERSNAHETQQQLQNVASWESGVMDAACIGNLPSHHAIETWGAGDSMGVAIRDTQTQSRIWVKGLEPEKFTQLTQAMRDKESYTFTAPALVREGTNLDKRAHVNVIAGRTKDGGILLSLRPTENEQSGYAVILSKDDAHRFANAMDIREPIRRVEYVTKLESLRQENPEPNTYEMEKSHVR